MGIDALKAYRLLRAVQELGAANLREIQARTKLSWTTVTKYVEILIRQGLLEEVESVKRGKVVRVTKKGLEFMYHLSQAMHILGEEL